MSTAAALPVAPSLPRHRTSALRMFGTDRLTMLREWNAAIGDTRIGEFRVMGRTLVLVNDPEIASELLLTRDADFHKGPALALYGRPLLGNGLLSSEEDFHRKQRRLVAPALAHRRVTGYAEPMAQATDTLADTWQDGETVDVAREMMRLTLEIVGKTLFDAEHVADEADELGRALTTLLEYFTSVVRSPLRPPFAWIPPWRQDVHRAMQLLDSTIYGLIRERRASGRDAGDLLSMLLLVHDEDSAPMSDRQIRDETMTLFLAGHETTAVALSWAWYVLANHPDIYARVREEAHTVLGDRLPTFADLEALPYTLAVLKETLRLYPPAFAVARQAVRDTTLGGFRVRAGTVVFVSPYLLHRDTRTFADPEQFNPERWLDPAFEKSLPRGAFLPFSTGPRVCIGAAFALMEGHLVLATLARRLTFERPANAPSVAPNPLITLRPAGAIPLIVHHRR